MKLIKPSFEILDQEFPVQKPDMSESQHRQALIDAMYRHIELCGRTCYKSTDKITEDSAKPFVDKMIASQHYAMLEHGTVYLYVPYLGYGGTTSCRVARKYERNKYSEVSEGYKDFCITTNLRVLVENNWLDDLRYICCPTEHHFQRYTVRFICNRQVSHEFVRHRVFSFAQESTRYCNYTKDKFGNELTFIWPVPWLGKYTPEDIDSLRDEGAMITYALKPGETDFQRCLSNTEQIYLTLIEAGWQPQQAATILPNAIKTELIMTGFEHDWKHFFDLRALGTTGAPHPQAKELAELLMNEFVNRGYISYES